MAAPSAVGLLRLLVCFAPEAVPLSLLLQPRPGLVGKCGAQVAPALGLLLNDTLAADEAIAALHRYSLASSAGDGRESVHRLAQAVTVDQPHHGRGQAQSNRPAMYLLSVLR